MHVHLPVYINPMPVNVTEETTDSFVQLSNKIHVTAIKANLVVGFFYVKGVIGHPMLKDDWV